MQILSCLTLIEGRHITTAPAPASYTTYLGICVNIPLALSELLHTWTSSSSGAFSVCVDWNLTHLCLLGLCTGFFFTNVVIKSGCYEIIDSAFSSNLWPASSTSSQLSHSPSASAIIKRNKNAMGEEISKKNPNSLAAWMLDRRVSVGEGLWNWMGY